MSEALMFVSRVGQAILGGLGPLNVATGFVLAGALAANWLLQKRVAASLRLFLFLLVFARLALPLGWSNPLGLLGRVAPAPTRALVDVGPIAVAVGATGTPSVGAPFWLGLAYLVVALTLLAAWTGRRVQLARRLRTARQFTIASTGAVVASVVQSSTLGNSAVESCVVNAARGWEFPKPMGGGLVIVSYPFVFTPR